MAVVKAKMEDHIEIDVSVGNPILMERTFKIAVADIVELLEQQVRHAVRPHKSKKSKTREALLSRQINYRVTAWSKGHWSNGAKVEDVNKLETEIVELISHFEDITAIAPRTYMKLVDCGFIGG